MAANSRLAEERQLLERLAQLRADANRLMRERGFEPGAVDDYPSAGGFSLSFGYIERPPGRGSRQRYIDVPLTVDEYLSMDEAVRRKTLRALEEQLNAR